MARKISISVRNLVEFVLRSGDIDNSFMSMGRALEGTKAHQKVQKNYGLEDRSEVFLKYEMEYNEFQIEVQGRADGILKEESHYIIDEIKSTTQDLEKLDGENELHWAQAKCYGYIFGKEKGLSNIDIQITYFHIESEEKRIFVKTYKLEELKKYFYEMISTYIEWASTTFYWGKERDESIKKINFPFEGYREGQRELAVAIYGSIEDRKNIFVEAPTGIGKTMSTVFPAIKSIGEGLTTKIFYLTAKTITREAPKKTMEILMKQNLKMKTVVITAKDKICINNEVKCNPRDCPYAKGHYNRVNDGIIDIFKNEDLIDREKIIEYSKKYKICPFEFTLDIALWGDIIICDYNYIFDPQVYLKRFFLNEGEDYVFLLDEAHNLIDRSRDMFSTEIIKEDLIKNIEIFEEGYRSIYNGLNRCYMIIENIIDLRNIKDSYSQREEISELYYPIKKVLNYMEAWLTEEKNHEKYDDILELYFNLMSYNKISEIYDENYSTYIDLDEEVGRIKLLCLDPSELLKEKINKSRSTIFFSATLSPIEYYRNLLGGSEKDYYIKLASPFPRNNISINVANSISTKYRDRDRTYGIIVDYILEFINTKEGNYFIFFPSYKYMETIYDLLIDEDPYLNILLQNNIMNEYERESFLMEFQRGNNIIGLGVLGGIFSEGIDLVGKELIGVAIIGVGMPMINYERDIMKEFFNEKFEAGFDYAYTYPGMNKVLQGVGRLIRSENDIGTVLLIDSRYGTNKYKKLFPRHWNGYNIIRNKSDISKYIGRFYGVENT